MCSHLLCIRRDADGQYQSQAGKRDFCSNCCLLDAVEGSSGSTCLCAGTVPTCAHHDDPFPSRTRALPGCPAWEMKSALNGKCNQAGPAREEKGQQKKNKFRSWNGKKKKLNAVCTAVPVTPSTHKGRLVCPTKVVQKGVNFPLAGFLLQHSPFLPVLALEKGAAGC